MENQIRHDNDNHQEEVQSFDKNAYQEQRRVREQVENLERQEMQRDELLKYYGRSTISKDCFKVPLLGKYIIGSQTFFLVAFLILFLYTLMPHGKVLIQKYSLIIF